MPPAPLALATLPPAADDHAAAAFEREIAERGEWKARLLNVVATVRRAEAARLAAVDGAVAARLAAIVNSSDLKP